MMSPEKSVSSLPPSLGRFKPPLRMCGLSRFRLIVALAVTILFVLTSIITYRPPHRGLLLVSSDDAQTQLPQQPIGYVVDNSQEKQEAQIEAADSARPPIAMVSMLYGDNQIYERAINTYLRYAERHKYPIYVLRKDLADGVWNKLAYLIHVLMTEMQKGEAGAPWLMWVDADSAVVNPALPLEIFLPPDDFADVHMIGSKDQNGFNAGMFLIRAHEWSIGLLANAMSLKGHHPEVMVGFAEQTALYIQFNQTEYRNHVLYQPRKWFNTYEFDFAYEGSPGDMFVHFVGLFEKRWDRMMNWLDILEGPGQKEWEIPLEQTKYPHEIDEFWSVVRRGRQALSEARDKTSLLPEKVLYAIERLDTVLWSETDQVPTVRNATEALRAAIRNMTGLATATEGGG